VTNHKLGQGEAEGGFTRRQEKSGVVALHPNNIDSRIFSFAVMSYNFSSIPACFKAELAVKRFRVQASTVKLRLLMGLNHISWSPLPWRTKVQP
jgi:hypothetical protein